MTYQSQTPNAIRLRARRQAIKEGRPVPVLTPDERKARQHANAPARARKGWETRKAQKLEQAEREAQSRNELFLKGKP